MRLSRLNLCLALALFGVLGLDFALTPRAGGGAAEPLFPGLSLEAVGRLALGEGAERLEIARGPRGFVLPGLGDFPVLEGAVRAPIEALARLTRLDRAGAGADLAAFGLEPGQALRLECFDLAGAPLAELEIGQRSGRGPAQGGGGVYLRRAGDPTVYAAPLLQALSTEPRSYWDGRLLPLTAPEVSALAVRGERFGSALDFELRRGPDGQFEDARGGALPRPSAEALLVALEALYLADLHVADDAATAFPVGLSLEVSGAQGPALRLEFESLGGSGAAGPHSPVRVRRSDWSPRWIGSLPRQALIDWLGPGGPLERLLGARGAEAGR